MNTFKHFSNAGKTLPSKIKHQNEIARKTEDILIFRAIFLTLQFSFTFPILSHSTQNITHFRHFLPLPIQFNPFPPFSTFLRFPCQLTAAQTIISSAYADSDSTYINQTNVGNNVKISGDSLVGDPSSVDANQVVKVLAEVPGTIQGITLHDGQLTQLQYIPEGKASSSGDCVTYRASEVNGVYKGSYKVGALTASGGGAGTTPTT